MVTEIFLSNVHAIGGYTMEQVYPLVRYGCYLLQYVRLRGMLTSCMILVQIHHYHY